MQLIFLLFLHHLADVAFQPSWLIEQKTKWFRVYEHSFIWAGTISCGLWLLGELSIEKFLFLLVGHFIIDYFKYKHKDYWLVYPDQALHYLQIIIVWIVK